MKKISNFWFKLLNMFAIALFATIAFAETKLLEQDKPQSGFIADYNLLTPVKGPDGAKIYRYTKLDFDPLAYDSVIIDPVIINQGVADDKITPKVVTHTAQALEASMRDRIGASKLKIVREPGPGVLRVSVSISGAELDTEGFKPRNILPISAAIKLVSLAAGKDEKKPVLLVESKIIDSKSEVLMRAGMITIGGESFRNQANTSQEFQALAKKIVDIAINNSNM
jgi:hypothetical protein